MRSFFGALVLCFAASLAVPAQATPTTDALGSCLVDRTTGHDRKVLARWFVATMSLHPELHDVVVMSAEAREAANQETANLFFRLVTVDCVNETRAAFKTDGAPAMRAAFSKLGEVAMQELMTNAAVQAGLNGLDRYVDRDKLADVFRNK